MNWNAVMLVLRNTKRVEDILGLCFFKALTNIEAKSRDISGKVIRNIIGANHSAIPFWQMLQQQYFATQIICECKNYDNLSADDFHQFSYYMNDKIGRAALLVHRGTSEL